MDKMNKEQFADYKRQFLEDKKQAYEAEPDVARLVRTKRLLWRILAVYHAVDFALAIIASVQLQQDMDYGLWCAKALFQFFWLYVFISPEGTWRINVMLYVSAAYNMITVINNCRQILQNLSLQGISSQEVLQSLPYFFQEQPVWAFGLLMEMLLPFLLLGIAMYLTLPKSHREQAERVQAILQKLQVKYNNKQ
ncbi:MAG: hypothetical protein NC305_19135 [Lachnospiraceae bacterium]|nr:hypothetical protein [Lachnospiraceae bacterium]